MGEKEVLFIVFVYQNVFLEETTGIWFSPSTTTAVRSLCQEPLTTEQKDLKQIQDMFGEDLSQSVISTVFKKNLGDVAQAVPASPLLLPPNTQFHRF